MQGLWWPYLDSIARPVTSPNVFKVSSLPSDKIADLSKFKAFADNCKCESDSNIEICLWKGRKHCGEREKILVPAFFPFPKTF